MVISATGTDNAPFSLCAGGREGPRDFKDTETGLEDLLTGVEWQQAEPVDRGNSVITRSFTVEREHDTEVAAELFMVEHRRLMPRQSDVTLQIEGGVTRKIIAALIRCTAGEHLGCVTIHSYILKGPNYSGL